VTRASPAPGRLRIEEELAGDTGGVPVARFRLDNGAGMSVSILSFGGVLESLHFPDRNGEPANVVLGYGSLDEYVACNGSLSPALPSGRATYFGALIGRFANRIAGGRFRLDGEDHEVSRNEGTSALHGGDVGFDQRVWASSPLREDGAVGVRLEYTSPAGEMGFPGSLHAVATYRLDAANRLSLELAATCDAPTVCNLTNHSYWNLGGESSGSALAHELTLAAGHYLPVDETLVPTGELRPVSGTPFDFGRPVPIEARIRDADEQLAVGHGYDHCFVLAAGRRRSPEPAATLTDPRSGRGLRLSTTQPGMQLYSGNVLDGALRGSGGRLYRQGDGIALEPEHFPDAPNHPEFPSTVLRPGGRYEETIVFELFCER
jgi:aldose 1-epimerase